MSPKRLPFWLALTLTLAALGCSSPSPPESIDSPRPSTSPAPVLATPPTPDPAAGSLDPFSPQSLRPRLERLADDSMRGRQTLTPGADRAGQLIARHFEAIGLEPLAGQSHYRVPYTLYSRGVDAARTGLLTGDVGWRAGVHMTPFDFSGEGVVEAPVVFAGYGISAPALGHDDYAGLDVRGKIVLVLRHHPDEKGQHPLSKTRHPRFKNKAEAARRRGARAMLLVTDPLHHPGADDLRLTSELRLKPKAPARRPATGFLSAHISREAAAHILAPGGHTLEGLQRAVDGGTKPAELDVEADAVELRVTREREDRARVAHNIIGVVPGAELPDQWVVYGAHYDHVGAFVGTGDTIFNGADDNASGTVGVMAIAEAFAQGPAPRRSMVFVAFSGEEDGLFGSEEAVASGALHPDRVVFMINLDMIGRNPGEPVQVFGDGFVDDGQARIARARKAAGLELELALGGASYQDNSDHHAFYRRGIPFVFFFAGFHDDYHGLGDHADKIDYGRLSAVARMALELGRDVAQAPEPPAFVHRLAWLGASLVQEGGRWRFAAVDKGSYAERAGLRAGDLLTTLDGQPTHRRTGRKLQRLPQGKKLALGVLAANGTRRTLHLARPIPGYLGVYYGEPSNEVRARLGLEANQGVAITNVVESSPAARAGLARGDVMVAIDGRPVNPGNLAALMAQAGAGNAVSVELGGDKAARRVVLGKRP